MDIKKLVEMSNGKLESKEIEKNGQKLVGVYLNMNGNGMSAVIYQDGVDYLSDGLSDEESVEKIIKTLTEETELAQSNPNFNTNIFDDMGALLDRLQIRAVSVNALGSKKAVKESGDVAFLYQVFFDVNGGGSAVMNDEIIDRICDELNITKDDVWKKAVENTANSMSVKDFLGTMTYTTNEYEYYGASALLVSGKARLEIVDRVGGAYYVIPSSIHETIIVPESFGKGASDIRALHEMCVEGVDERDRLTNEVFYVDNEGNLSVA